ncbi:uncharacterized protein LOC124937409 [Impatiens glandulifera]|uniref:uncharacterized protein LOC124937409 n=1 Tax=Impatiens glandulifera TaxID=253017 RepID=UPI001FB1534E|nr:uncharacterized protein LOC124937409 [Impatiens glandulifera]
MAVLLPSSEFSFRLELPSKCLFRSISNTVRWHNNDVKFKLQVRASLKIKDLDSVRELSAPVKLTKQEEEEENRRNYYVNTGYAIRTLREEFPQLFYKELRFDIYRDDIVFKDPLNTFSGIDNYKSIFWGLRFHGKMFFKAAWLDIISIWQPAEGIIMVRWSVHGISRVPWETRSRFDGVSEYKLDEKGKIYEHKVHNIALNGPPKFKVLGVEELIQSLAGPSTPKPTYFKITKE